MLHLRNICYFILAHPVFSDIMFAHTVSRRGNSCEQVYVTDFRLAQAFPVSSRCEAHETLLLLFAKDGFLQACVCENAKEMIQVKFYEKLKDYMSLEMVRAIYPPVQCCRKRD